MPSHSRRQWQMSQARADQRLQLQFSQLAIQEQELTNEGRALGNQRDQITLHASRSPSSASSSSSVSSTTSPRSTSGRSNPSSGSSTISAGSRIPLPRRRIRSNLRVLCEPRGQ